METSMARLQNPGPNKIPEDVGDFLAKFPPDTMFKMLSHSPSTIQPFIRLAQALYTSLELPVRSRELAILTLAETVQCEFVFAQHVPISEEAGVDEKIRQLIRNRDHANPALSGHDRAIIQFAAEIVTRPCVSDTIFSTARQFLSEREIVELLHLCGYYWTFSRVCTVLEVDLTQMYAQVSVEGFPAGNGNSAS
jgi:alkylhydroperoxidase family enzyme